MCVKNSLLVTYTVMKVSKHFTWYFKNKVEKCIQLQSQNVQWDLIYLVSSYSWKICAKCIKNFVMFNLQVYIMLCMYG